MMMADKNRLLVLNSEAKPEELFRVVISHMNGESMEEYEDVMDFVLCLRRRGGKSIEYHSDATVAFRCCAAVHINYEAQQSLEIADV